MFDSSDYPKPLSEADFNTWLEEGRESKIPYTHLLVIWDAYDNAYRPIYIEDRKKIDNYEKHPEATGREALIAAYDLYSESRIG